MNWQINIFHKRPVSGGWKYVGTASFRLGRDLFSSYLALLLRTVKSAAENKSQLMPFLLSADTRQFSDSPLLTEADYPAPGLHEWERSLTSSL
ncbi:hypothetical protein EMCG_01158 [[Emmonsia] crescens]|uniref:Uncharacterized protein n=1 Tax=[Emmonsia] crescens TaxID=73230 RepID=A0A0G2I652_9EURO|nr:hypothetical protein EMCG_01158 [Emmonsia crescens UAMH 3008]